MSNNYSLKKDYQYNVGLDIGITSVGFSIIDVKNAKLIKMGVRHFEEANEAKDVRLNRGARRLIDRKHWRKKQLKDAFVDFGLISREEIDKKNYLQFSYCDEDNLKIIEHDHDVHTVYHLRKKALNEKVSKRELLVALHNICKTRGHFLLENVDFENNSTINFEEFKNKYYDLTEPIINYVDNRDDFDLLLNDIFEKKIIRANDLKTKAKQLRIVDGDDSNIAIQELLKIICGFSGDISKVTDTKEYIGENEKITINKIKSLESDKSTEFLNGLVELYDIIQIHSILKEHNYLCESAVDKLDELVKMYSFQYSDIEKYNDYKKDVQSKMNVKFDKTDKIRVIKNLDNNFPNGLYVKEAKAILYKQQEYHKEITDEFIEVVASIISARIPFYIGPLDINAKNAWIDNKKVNFKYSYEYTQKNLSSIDEKHTIKQWKERMISHCTYLPDELALPKGSFIYELFNILNEINILQAIDNNGELYYLSYDDKIKIINQLFLKKEKVKYEDVAYLLGLYSFGTKNNKSQTKFNNCFTLYHNIKNILPELKVNDIKEIFSNKEKIDKLESIILDISLFDEEKARRNNFVDEFCLEKAERLGKLKVKGFYSLSKKFLMEEKLNSNGESIIDILFSDNKDGNNEQMSIIQNATDENGKEKNLTANKYERLLKENDNKLSVDLLIDGTKPIIPISRPVLRGLNECFKIYEEIIKVYGIPNRLIIETAKDFNSKEEKAKKKTIKHDDIVKNIYDDIKKNKDKKISQMRASLEDWDSIYSYLKKNSKKIELYVQQLGNDIIDGNKIDLNRLDDYEIDHILPRGFGDDSMNDKILISKNNNSKKGDRVPLQYINESMTTTTKNYVDRVNTLFENNLISEEKRKRLLLEDTENAVSFINQNLVDTRYIIKEFTSMISAYNKINSYNTHIVSIKSHFTNLARKAFYLKKNRDFGLQHHAHDACMVVIADACLNAFYPNYDSRGDFKKYQEFISSLKEDKNCKEDKNIIMMRAAFKKAFNQPFKFLISDIKNTIPLYSEKVLKKGSGQYFEMTILKPDDTENPLKVIDVNNEKRKFSGVNCCAVDFYRYTIKDKKTNKIFPRHVAIHIPKVIVDKNGNINEEKYKLLIKNWYKEDELLDEKGQIIEGYFRFRAYKNDIVYDTFSNIPQAFILGSIANKKLELKHIDMNSYSSIYDQALLLFNDSVKHFGWRDDEGKVKYKELDVEIAKDFIFEELGIADEKYIKTISEKTKDVTKLMDYCELVSYYYLWVIKPNTPPSINGQYTPVINKTEFKGSSDIEYVKLKYTPLGFRFVRNDKGKLLIYGPHGNIGGFSKIRKEKFSWKISKYSL